ncbi:hypothetical protein QVD17_06467 [Tagetes erecta]|uniref:Uncharacterized protein n=1 Tax=Tagetes erecta TaxID=13708 RepID=A0AAD8LG24_TARER|nr:hypothetical protein QVD17_06467 [Tagetes erecta]
MLEACSCGYCLDVSSINAKSGSSKRSKSTNYEALTNSNAETHVLENKPNRYILSKQSSKAADNKATFFLSHSLQRHLLLYL